MTLLCRKHSATLGRPIKKNLGTTTTKILVGIAVQTPEILVARITGKTLVVLLENFWQILLRFLKNNLLKSKINFRTLTKFLNFFEELLEKLLVMLLLRNQKNLVKSEELGCFLSNILAALLRKKKNNPRIIPIGFVEKSSKNTWGSFEKNIVICKFWKNKPLLIIELFIQERQKITYQLVFFP